MDLLLQNTSTVKLKKMCKKNSEGAQTIFRIPVMGNLMMSCMVFLFYYYMSSIPCWSSPNFASLRYESTKAQVSFDSDILIQIPRKSNSAE